MITRLECNDVDALEQHRRLRIARRDALNDPHIGALSRWIDEENLGGRTLPYFDPLDGGVEAKLLILLQSPARDPSWPRFVSRDNRGPAQRNLKVFLSESGLRRSDTILWNVYPWLPDLKRPHRSLTQKHIMEGITFLMRLIDRLPRLTAVVFAGRVAQQALPRVRTARPTLKLLCMPHPSPLSVCVHPHVRRIIAETLTSARTAIRRRPSANVERFD